MREDKRERRGERKFEVRREYVERREARGEEM